MDKHPDWKTHFDEEIKQAEAARAANNEGMARVCARRAAGVAIGEYLGRCGLPDPGPSAYDRIQYLANLSGVPPEVHQVAEHLLTRVTPERSLPIKADLIAEARWLGQTLLESRE